MEKTLAGKARDIKKQGEGKDEDSGRTRIGKELVQGKNNDRERMRKG